jgi:dCMP deaminase
MIRKVNLGINMKNRDKIFMDIAGIMAQASTCKRAHNGCLIVSEKNRVLSAGYNGSASGEPHCEDVGCEIERDDEGQPHCVRTMHAELNAIINAAKSGVSLEGSILYCTMAPCYMCAKAIINAGIKRVIYFSSYVPADGLELLKRRIEVEKWQELF